MKIAKPRSSVWVTRPRFLAGADIGEASSIQRKPPFHAGHVEGARPLKDFSPRAPSSAVQPPRALDPSYSRPFGAQGWCLRS